MSKIATLWFDKDGVLAQYDYSLYEPEYNAPAPWLIHNAHVFRNLEPYANMCAAVRKLYAETCDRKADKRRCNVRVLTAVSDGVTLAEHVMDGMDWCSNNIGLKRKDFYACAVAKESIPVTLRDKLEKTDVLFDDYMPNLYKWDKAGGTAIKVVNGINSVTEEIPCIMVDWDSDTLYKTFGYIANTVAVGEVLSGGMILPFT